MTRARDLDRVETCNVLDAAYAEGQLSADDYFERTEKARSAKTLLALARLVNDLQVPKIATKTVPRTSTASRTSAVSRRWRGIPQGSPPEPGPPRSGGC